MPELLAALPPRGFVPGEGEEPLEVIDLCYNEITDFGVQELLFRLAAGAAPALKTLNLGKTQVSEVGKRQLQGLKLLRRGLQIVDDDDVFKLASFAEFTP